MAIGKDGATEQTKLAVFLRTVGPRVNDMYETLRFEEGTLRKNMACHAMTCHDLDPSHGMTCQVVMP